MSTIGKIIITKELQEIIDTLHRNIEGKEWSGVLFYEYVSGSIKDWKDLVFKAKYFYPMDIGTTAATEFEYSPELMDAYDIFPDAIDCNTGLCHTHYGLGAFFSGTDIQELQTNAAKYNYYVSLVVSNKRDYKCKIVFPSVDESVIVSTFKDSAGKPYKKKITKTTNSTIIHDLDVEYEMVELDSAPWLTTQIAKLKTKASTTTVKSSIPSYSGISNSNIYSRGDYEATKVPMQDRSEFANDINDAYSQLFNSYSGTNTKSVKKVSSIALEEQFIINLICTQGYGMNLKSALNSLVNLTPEEIELFGNNLEMEFEPIYFDTFSADKKIDRRKLHKVLGIILDNEDAYPDCHALDYIKDQVIYYL